MADSKAQPPFLQGNPANKATTSSGGHDFIEDPKSAAPATGGRDFTKESREQKDGDNGANADSIPEGGKDPFAQTDKVAKERYDVGTEVDAEVHKPFKLGGGS